MIEEANRRPQIARSARVLFQQAWFVTSIDDAARRWAEAFGAGPFFMARHHKTEVHRAA